MNVFKCSARKLVQEAFNENGYRGLDGSELGKINTTLVIAHDPIGNDPISIQKKDPFIEFELLENIHKGKVFTIDVLLDILRPRIGGYNTKE
jgi:hypothetical protein